MTVFSDAFLSHYSSLKEQCGVSGTYRQLATSGTITMLPAVGINEQDTSEGIVSTSRDSDLIATVEDLRSIGCWPPLRGDTFEYTSASNVTGTFEAMPNAGEHVWDWDSPTTKLAVRIHMKEVLPL